jgi:hypothetical protein
MWAQILSLLLGIWMLFAPDALGYSDPARSVDRAIGPIIIVVAAVAIRGVTRPMRHLNTLTGLALLIVPWVFTYDAISAIANSALVGMAVLGLSLVRGRLSHSYGGGWSTLWNSEILASGMR